MNEFSRKKQHGNFEQTQKNDAQKQDPRKGINPIKSKGKNENANNPQKGIEKPRRKEKVENERAEQFHLSGNRNGFNNLFNDRFAV